MKRDWDLIRKILVKAEELSTPTGHITPDVVPGYDEELVSYHIQLLGQAGLLEIVKVSGPLSSTLICWAKSMTWEGHEFLDKIRRDTVWNRIKGIAREKGLDLSIEFIKVAGTDVITSLLKN